MIRQSLQDRILILFFYMITGAFALLCLLPFVLALVCSMTDEVALFRDGYRLWTSHFNLKAYTIIFSESNTVYKAYAVTILTTAVGTLFAIFLTSFYAYPLSIKTFKYKNAFSLFAYITMLFNGGLIPNYIILSKYYKLYDNIWVLIIPGALSAFNVFLMRNYFSTIPESLAESAKLDGASDTFIFVKIVLPLSKPIIATVALFVAMGYWNEWFKALMYIDNPDLYTLQFLIMRLQRETEFLTSSLGAKVATITGQRVPVLGIRLATAMVSIGPILLLYPFLQKYFTKGLVVGAVKG